jgi:hypothetical protein
VPRPKDANRSSRPMRGFLVRCRTSPAGESQLVSDLSERKFAGHQIVGRHERSALLLRDAEHFLVCDG